MQSLHFVQLLRMLSHLTHLDFWLLDEGDVSSRMTHFHAALNEHTMLPVGLQNLRKFPSVPEIGFTTELLIAVMALLSIRAIAVAISDNYGEDSEAEIAGTLAILEMANATVGSSTLTRTYAKDLYKLGGLEWDGREKRPKPKSIVSLLGNSHDQK